MLKHPKPTDQKNRSFISFLLFCFVLFSEANTHTIPAVFTYTTIIIIKMVKTSEKTERIFFIWTGQDWNEIETGWPSTSKFIRWYYLLTLHAFFFLSLFWWWEIIWYNYISPAPTTTTTKERKKERLATESGKVFFLTKTNHGIRKKTLPKDFLIIIDGCNKKKGYCAFN